MRSMAYEPVTGTSDLEDGKDSPNCLDGVRVSPHGGGSGIAMTVCVLFLMLGPLGLLFTLFMGINLNSIAPDIAKGAFPEAAQDVGTALQKLWKQLPLGIWHDLAYVPALLLQVWALAIQWWPIACLGLAAMAGLLFLGMRAPLQSGCLWQEAASRSLQKCLRMAFGILLPVGLVYCDILTDLFVLRNFWMSKRFQYFTLNLLAIMSGLLTSAVIGPGGVHLQGEVLFGMQRHLHLLSGLQLTPLFCMILAFKEFSLADLDTGRSWSFENKLRDGGITALLSSTTIGETFGEALLSSFVQLYAALRQGPLQWPSLLAFSVLLSLFSISKSFACIDQMGTVSRYRHGQAIVVGIAKPASVAFVVVVLYRLTAVCSRLLLFPMFQLALHQELQIWHVSYGGALLWTVDCVLQAALVLYSTGNHSKLLLAVPNTISAYEPLLLNGSGALLSVKISLHALVHAAQAVAIVFIVMAYGSAESRLWEEHQILLRLLASCALLQWPLLWVLRRFCAHQILQQSSCVIDILAEQTRIICDKADATVPLDIAALVPLAIQSGCDVKKLLDLVVQGGLQPHVVEQALLLVRSKASKAFGDELEGKVVMMELGAAQAILTSMSRHRNHAAVQQSGCGALQNLAVNDENRVKLMELEAAQSVLEAMKRHPAHAAVQEYGCGALANLAVNDANQVKLMELEAAQSVLEAMKRHRDHAGVQQSGCSALWSLAVNDENKVKLMELEAAQSILEAMKRHRDHADVQQSGCGALWILAMSDENKVKLMELEAAQSVLEAMKRHPDHAGVQRRGGDALRLLGCSNLENP